MKATRLNRLPLPTPPCQPYEIVLTVETRVDEKMLAALAYSNMQVPEGVAYATRQFTTPHEVYAFLGVLRGALRNSKIPCHDYTD